MSFTRPQANEAARSRSRRWRLIASLLCLGVFLALPPVSAHADPAGWYYSSFYRSFSGSSCGSTDRWFVTFYANESQFQSENPQLGQVLTDDTGTPVARITAVNVVTNAGGGGHITWVATGSDDVCANPDFYPTGWQTSNVYFHITWYAKATYWTSCQPPSSFFSGTLLAHGVGCPTARHVVNGYLVKTQQQGTNRVRVLGFDCHQVGQGFSCIRGGKRVRMHGTPG